MKRTIRSEIIMLVVSMITVVLLSFKFITVKHYQNQSDLQQENLAKETFDSTIRILNNEFDDILSHEIDTIYNQRSALNIVGNSLLSMINSFYDLQKSGILTKQVAKEKCLSMLDKYRSQDQHYFFIYDFDLFGISHPNKKMEGQKWIGFKDLKKNDALKSIRDIIKDKNKSFTVFLWPSQKDMRLTKHIGLFLYFPQWEWIIGIAKDMDNIEKISLAKKKSAIEKMRRIFSQISLNKIGGIIIFENNGKIILNTSELENVNFNRVVASIRNNLKMLPEKTSKKVVEHIQYKYTNNNQKESNQTAYTYSYKYMDWNVVVFFDWTEFEKASNIIISSQIFLLFLVLLNGILIAVYISGKITFSVSTLAEYARLLPTNRFGINPSPVLKDILANSRNEDIKQLIKAFTFMETQLAEYIGKLEGHKKNLKNAVKIRTKELASANKRLSLEIIERKQKELDVKQLNKSLDKKVKERTYKLKQLNEYVINNEESERKLFAADLHDSVAQTLSFVTSKIKNIQESDLPTNMEEVAEIQKYLELSIAEVRSLIYKLSPPMIDDFNIEIVLESLIEDNNKKYDAQIAYVNNSEDTTCLNRINKITLYRAVNEIFINIIKHSGLKKGKIEIFKKDEFLFIKIEDRGNGFDMEKLHSGKQSRFGLYFVSERINSLGGNVEISSKPGQGTKILLSLPMI